MKLNQLTFTRFLAAFAIVVYHSGVNIAPFDRGMLNGFFKSSQVLVSYFFILSGFVMMIAYGQKGFKPINYALFYTNRFARIYPLYLLALLLVLVVGFHAG